MGVGWGGGGVAIGVGGLRIGGGRATEPSSNRVLSWEAVGPWLAAPGCGVQGKESWYQGRWWEGPTHRLRAPRPQRSAAHGPSGFCPRANLRAAPPRAAAHNATVREIQPVAAARALSMGAQFEAERRGVHLQEAVEALYQPHDVCAPVRQEHYIHREHVAGAHADGRRLRRGEQGREPDIVGHPPQEG